MKSVMVSIPVEILGLAALPTPLTARQGKGPGGAASTHQQSSVSCCPRAGQHAPRWPPVPQKLS